MQVDSRLDLAHGCSAVQAMFEDDADGTRAMGEARD